MGLGFWSNSQGESVKPGGQPAPGLGGEEWVRGTRREPIHGGSCTASMPYTVPRTHTSPPLKVGRRPWTSQRQDPQLHPQLQTSIPASRSQTPGQGNSDPTALPLHCAGAFADGPGNCRGLVGVGSRGPPSHGCDGGAYRDVLAACPGCPPPPAQPADPTPHVAKLWPWLWPWLRLQLWAFKLLKKQTPQKRKGADLSIRARRRQGERGPAAAIASLLPDQYFRFCDQ